MISLLCFEVRELMRVFVQLDQHLSEPGESRKDLEAERERRKKEAKRRKGKRKNLKVVNEGEEVVEGKDEGGEGKEEDMGALEREESRE